MKTQKSLTPKEQELEMYNGLKDEILGREYPECSAKRCALYSVDMILDNMMFYVEQFEGSRPVHHRSFWQEVKEELEKL
jgi:hypothetical protein